MPLPSPLRLPPAAGCVRSGALLGLYALRPRVGRLRRKGNSAFVIGSCAAVVAGLIIVSSGGLTSSTHMIGALLAF